MSSAWRNEVLRGGLEVFRGAYLDSSSASLEDAVRAAIAYGYETGASVSRGVLQEIATSDPVDNALDPGRNVRIAREALS